MNEIKVKSIPEELIKELDKIYLEKGYKSRSALIVDVLTKYCAFGSKFYVDELPSTVKILVKNELERYPQMLKELLERTLYLVDQNTEFLQKVNVLIEPDFEEFL